MTPKLFEPIQIGGLTLSNRIVVAPMCQYSAVDGHMTDWHLIHLGHLALSGEAELTIEATAVEPEGRITYADTGLWDDATEAAMARTIESIRHWSDIPLIIQLAHAGRKASTDVPWEGGEQFAPDHKHGWQTVAPSPIPFESGEHPPKALDRTALERIRASFAASARRAARLGLDGVQIHVAHGYLLHEFLSPLSNRREDEYGWRLEHRMRFPLEVFDAVRAAFRPDRPVTVRVSGTDWVDGGWDIAQSRVFVEALQARGLSFLHVSSGGVSPQQKIPIGPGYQVHLAEQLKRETGAPTIAVGLITEPAQAEAIVAGGQADAVALARGMLFDPRWPWHAAAQLGAQVDAPPQYWRSQPRGLNGLFGDVRIGMR